MLAGRGPDSHRALAQRQVELYSLLIAQYTLTGRYEQAIAAGRKALGLLGIGLPDPANEREVSAAFDAEAAIIQNELAQQDISKLLDRPMLQSPEKLWAMRVLVSMNAAGMYTSRPLYNLLVAKKSASASNLATVQSRPLLTPASVCRCLPSVAEAAAPSTCAKPTRSA